MRELLGSDVLMDRFFEFRKKKYGGVLVFFCLGFNVLCDNV